MGRLLLNASEQAAKKRKCTLFALEVRADNKRAIKLYKKNDYVLIGREGGVERDFAQLRAELIAAFERVRAGKGDPPRGPRSKGGGKKPGKSAGRGGAASSPQPVSGA